MIEFEQKYVCDHEDAHELIDLFTTRYRATSHRIEQFYDNGPDKFRYRREKGLATRERKNNIPSPGTYTVSSEHLVPIKDGTFNGGFAKSKQRLQKMRYVATHFGRSEGYPAEHKLTLDLFMTKRKVQNGYRMQNGMYVYAAIVESETMLVNGITELNLNFRLPKSLNRFVLRIVDSRKADDKVFGSKRLCDKAGDIKVITSAVEKLRGSKPC